MKIYKVKHRYGINTNFSDDGFDHYIAVKAHEEAPENFEKVIVPSLTWAVFETTPMRYPTKAVPELRKQVFTQWLPTSEYMLAEGPEIEVAHWYRGIDTDKRYSELWIPVVKK